MLQIWLPLNGNTNNLGLLGDAAITGNVGFASTGKIGTKSMNSGKLTLSAKDADKILNNEAFSYCCWIYVNADPGTTAGCSAFFGRENMNSDGNRQFTMFQYNNVNSFHWSWQNDFVTDSSIFTGGGVLSDVFPSRKWTHFAMAYKKGEYKFYTNGNCIYTGNANSNSLSFSYSLPIVVCSSARYLNDVRLYDHCLSPKEVKEISKGMICHYPMNQIDGNLIGRNLLTQTNQGKTLWRCGHDGGEYACESVEWLGINAAKMSCTTKTASWKMFTHNSLLTNINKLEAGGQYTLSYDTSDKAPFCSLMTAQATLSLIATQNQTVIHTSYGYHYIINMTLKDTLTQDKQVVYFYNNLNNGESVIIANLKLEKGIADTHWIPAVEDIPINDNTVYDTSGYSNHGTFGSGEYIECNSDSPRYDICYKLDNGGYPCINTPNFSFENITRGTVSIWINRHSSNSVWRNYLMFADGYNWTGNEHDFIIYGSTGGQGVTMDCCSCTYTFTPELNTWYLYTLSWDLTTHTVKFYINGELKGSKTDNKIGTTYASKHGQHYIGNASYQTSDYSISDFRLYTTVLSDTDIKELYNTPISLTNTGTLMTQGEFKEA